MPITRHIPKWASLGFGLLSLPKVLLGKALGVFQPLERTVLDAVRAQLSAADRLTFDSQLKEINVVQCVTAKTSEIDFLRVSIEGLTLKRKNPFFDHSSEFKLAKVRFSVRSEDSVIARIWVVQGALFSIEFDRDIRPIRRSSELSIHDVTLRQAGSSK